MSAFSDAKLAAAVHFPQWAEHLAAADDLPEPLRLGHAVTLRWYFAYCRRQQRATSFDSARAFLADIEQARQPAPAQLEQWKEALRWFFRQARAAGRGVAPSPRSAAVPPGDGWPEAVRRMLRLRHYSYRTEQTYLDWAARLVRFHGGRPLERAGGAEVRAFLSRLAVEERVGVATQNQASRWVEG